MVCWKLRDIEVLVDFVPLCFYLFPTKELINLLTSSRILWLNTNDNLYEYCLESPTKF
jgi:hypothetical protein